MYVEQLSVATPASKFKGVKGEHQIQGAKKWKNAPEAHKFAICHFYVEKVKFGLMLAHL